MYPTHQPKGYTSASTAATSGIHSSKCMSNPRPIISVIGTRPNKNLIKCFILNVWLLVVSKVVLTNVHVCKT